MDKVAYLLTICMSLLDLSCVDDHKVDSRTMQVTEEKNEQLMPIRIYRYNDFSITKVDNTFYFLFSTSDESNPYALYKIEKTESNTSNPTISRKEGDVNDDGEVDATDITKLIEILGHLHNHVG